MKVAILVSQTMAIMAMAAAIQRRVDADSDEAVVYPASVDQSWVDARRDVDSDDAVVYPASVDQSWVDADTS